MERIRIAVTVAVPIVPPLLCERYLILATQNGFYSAHLVLLPFFIQQTFLVQLLQKYDVEEFH